MRNKLHITESEMKIILSLNKDKINEERSHLNKKTEELDEEDKGQSTGRIMAGSGSGAAAGAAIGALLTLPAGGVGAAPGSLIGAGIGALIGWMTTGGGFYDKVVGVLKWCNTNRGKMSPPVNSDDRIRDIADDISLAVRGLGTDEVMIARSIKKLKSIPDLCRLNDIYRKRNTESLLNALDGDIDQDGEWRDYVWRPIESLYEYSKKKTDEDLKKNAQKCGWGTDIDGYRKSGWRCPKNKKPIPPPVPIIPDPIPGGGGYEIDYQKIMDAIKQKCVTPGGGDTEDFPLDWNAVGSDKKIDRTMSKDSIDKLFKD
jgi:hypothetical protein